MTFQLKYARISEENNELNLFYKLEGELPVNVYNIKPIKFNFENSEFSVKYSIVGDFVVKTDAAFLQTTNNATVGLEPPTSTPIERLNIKLNRQVSNEVKRMLTLLNNPSSTLDDLST